MEHTLGEVRLLLRKTIFKVLILVLMEHTLGVEYPQHFKEWVKGVLILVLMEHTLGGVSSGFCRLNS